MLDEGEVNLISRIFISTQKRTSQREPSIVRSFQAKFTASKGPSTLLFEFVVIKIL